MAKVMDFSNDVPKMTEVRVGAVVGFDLNRYQQDKGEIIKIRGDQLTIRTIQDETTVQHSSNCWLGLD